MKILVTGATGFLGKYVIDELLAHDYSIVAFGRNEKIGKALEGERVRGSRWSFIHCLGTLEGLLSG